MASSGVKLVSAGVDRSSSMRALSISEANRPLVRAFVGVHPSEAEKGDDAGWLGSALGRAAGVGEIGLDPKYSATAFGSAQRKVFQGQLEAAEKAGKPVQIHSRGAEKECLDDLSRFHIARVQMHWFASEELTGSAEDRGYYVSFGPALLSSKKLQRMARRWGRDRILTESDGPISFPGLGGAGGPSLIPTVVFSLAEVIGEGFQDTAALVEENSLAFLGEKA